jgi:hypothetical protein
MISALSAPSVGAALPGPTVSGDSRTVTSRTAGSERSVYIFSICNRPEVQISVAKHPTKGTNPINLFLNSNICRDYARGKYGISAPKFGTDWLWKIIESATARDDEYYVWKYRRTLEAEGRVITNAILPEKLTMFDYLSGIGVEQPCLEDYVYLFQWQSPSLRLTGKPSRKLLLTNQTIAQAKTTINFQGKKAGTPLHALMTSPDLEFSVSAAFDKSMPLDQMDRETTRVVEAELRKYRPSELIGRPRKTLHRSIGKRSRGEDDADDGAGEE